MDCLGRWAPHRWLSWGTFSIKVITKAINLYHWECINMSHWANNYKGKRVKTIVRQLQAQQPVLKQQTKSYYDCTSFTLRDLFNTTNTCIMTQHDLYDEQTVRICGNKMPTRCNRCFYCRSYCLLNMFRASLCPSSGAQEYYTVVAACGILCCGFQVAGLVWSWGLCVRFAGCW